jgi:hypothetical protein
LVPVKTDDSSIPVRIYQVQDGGRVLLATADLSSPSGDGSRPVGAGLELFVESDEPLGGPLPLTWLQSLLVSLRQLAVETPDLRQQIDELGLLSVGVDGTPFPPSMRGVDGTVGVLIGLPVKKYPSSYKVGNHNVLLVAATVLKPDELELLIEGDEEGDEEGYEALASALSESGVGHLSQMWRDSMVEEVDEEEGGDEEGEEDGDEDDEDDDEDGDEDGDEDASHEGGEEDDGAEDDLGDAGPMIAPGEEGALADFPATRLQLEIFRELRRDDPQRNLMERLVHFRFIDEQQTERLLGFVPQVLRQGWAVLSFPGSDNKPDVYCTVGLHYRYNLPELVVCARGWPAEQVRRALSRAALEAALGEPVGEGGEAGPVLSFSGMDAEQRAAYLPASMAFFFANMADASPPPARLAWLEPQGIAERAAPPEGGA